MKKEIETFFEALEIVPECKKMTIDQAREYMREIPFSQMKLSEALIKTKAIKFILNNWNQSKQQFDITLDLAYEMKTFGERK